MNKIYAKNYKACKLRYNLSFDVKLYIVWNYFLWFLRVNSWIHFYIFDFASYGFLFMISFAPYINRVHYFRLSFLVDVWDILFNNYYAP